MGEDSRINRGRGKIHPHSHFGTSVTFLFFLDIAIRTSQSFYGCHSLKNMSSDGESRKVQIELVLTIIAGIVGLIALMGLVYVLCLLQHRHQQHHLRQQQQQQRQQGTTIRPPSRAKMSLSRHRQQQASNRRQQKQQQQYVLSTPPQPDDTYSIDSSGTMIELQQRFNSGSGLRSVESNSSYMADMFSLTSDMLMQQSSPATLSTPPRPPHSSSDTSTGVNFIPNFAPLPIASSPAIILNHPHPHNDTSTAGDDDDFDEVWSYVAVRPI